MQQAKCQSNPGVQSLISLKRCGLNRSKFHDALKHTQARDIKLISGLWWSRTGAKEAQKHSKQIEVAAQDGKEFDCNNFKEQLAQQQRHKCLSIAHDQCSSRYIWERKQQQEYILIGLK